MRILTLISLTIVSSLLHGQEIVTDLNGFRLGQFRDVPKNELKIILQQDIFEDGFEYEIYPVEKDTSVYMIFEYANFDLETIWSIQLTGNKMGFDCAFKDLKLGMSVNEIENKLGKPSSIEDAGEYGEKWVYDKTNFTLEVKPDRTLGGIKIIDMSHDFFPDPDLKKIPSFKEYTKILNSKNRKTISELLAPGIEIYKNDSVYFFKNSWKKEVETDESGIFNLVDETLEKLNKVNPEDTLQYEENMRIAFGQDTKHVAKFKVNNVYSEIVFKYMFGRYVIWEIKLK